MTWSTAPQPPGHGLALCAAVSKETLAKQHARRDLFCSAREVEAVASRKATWLHDPGGNCDRSHGGC